MLDTNGKPIVIKVGGSDFTTVPADRYTCQICSVEAVEQPNTFKGGALETRLNYKFVILDPKKEDEKLNSLRGRYLWRRTSTSLNEKSWLFKILKGVLGHQPTDKELKEFDPETSLVGKWVDCLVEQSPSKDGSRVFANIISFSKANTKGYDGKDLEAFDYEAAKAKTTERTSQAVPAATKSDVDDFIAGLEEDKKNTK